MLLLFLLIKFYQDRTELQQEAPPSYNAATQGMDYQDIPPTPPTAHKNIGAQNYDQIFT